MRDQPIHEKTPNVRHPLMGGAPARTNVYKALEPGIPLARLYWKNFSMEPISDSQIIDMLCKVSMFEFLAAVMKLGPLKMLTLDAIVEHSAIIRASVRKRSPR